MKIVFRLHVLCCLTEVSYIDVDDWGWGRGRGSNAFTLASASPFNKLLYWIIDFLRRNFN